MQTEQKAQEESERLRQQEREAMAEKRRADLVFSNLFAHFERLPDNLLRLSAHWNSWG